MRTAGQSDGGSSKGCRHFFARDRHCRMSGAVHGGRDRCELFVWIDGGLRSSCLCCCWFAVKNAGRDPHGLFLGPEWQAPLVFVLLAVFVAGVVPACSRGAHGGQAAARDSVSGSASSTRAPGAPSWRSIWPHFGRRAPAWNSSSGGCSPCRSSSAWAGSPRASTSSRLLSESRALPSSYFRGLNFLLNEQPDKAIESFLQVAKEESADRGAAVRAGQPLSPARRGRPRDPHAPGPGESRGPRRPRSGARRPSSCRRTTSRRACSTTPSRCSRKHGASPIRRREVHRHLLDIYIQEKDWGKAIDAGQEARGERQAQLPEGDRELLLRARDHRAHPWARARKPSAMLDKALDANRKCVRANLLRGEWLARDGKHEQALEAWKAIESQDPAYFGARGRAAWWKATRRSGRPDEGLTLLRGLQHRYPGLDFLNVVYQTTAEIEGDDAAYRLVRDEVRRNPTLVGLDRLIDAELARAPAEAAPGPAAHEEPGAFARAGARRVPVRELRIQGAAILLAMPRVRRMGDVPPAPHGRARKPGAPPREDANWTISESSFPWMFPMPMRRSPSPSRLDPKLCRREGRQGALRRRGPRGGHALAGSRLRGVPRPQVPRHPQYRGGRLPLGRAAGRLDDERARERRRSDAARGARGGEYGGRARRC